MKKIFVNLWKNNFANTKYRVLNRQFAYMLIKKKKSKNDKKFFKKVLKSL